ncbi:MULTISPECIES: SsrA-binding protein SmpB [Ponticaulis]|jgi:SsrA-binding protein|uniref:SsrA-binding protein SmpB n=1 Tax=Ponticaulis TaxID=1123044 RepID=UPI0003B529AE|nr:MULTISPECIES: SsrA-binding protein SmpB [Ponticaulis]MAJ08525.1 SsrA-binding protein SmpB [Ponticaulis sp.]MBN04404.1 SsrA-binding protein SmpB [Ponticaulis sp.]MDF1681768.1 SsrA-binding protein SmpB [Ponticaulis sp.]|tara:strand:+ start:34171 stop:34629 length:459 start_codon:yes stop_codon:yes gene_type:complete
MAAKNLIAENRRARRDYEIEDTLEAGIVLVGSEVKSLRNGKANIAESYASIEDGGFYLINADIPIYTAANRFNHEPKRKRKLLVHGREIARIAQAIERQGRTAIPLKLYFNDRGIAKLEIGIAKGRKTVDKRHAVKERDWNRDKQRLMKERG